MTSFEFDVTARDPFVIDLTAGWNAISFPANPVDTALDAVFTDEAIDRVVGWNPMSPDGPVEHSDPYRRRLDDECELRTIDRHRGPVRLLGPLDAAFVKQSVDLRGQINRETGGKPDPIGIYTVPGWNFIGVVDQDGDQTEDNFGDELRARDGDRNDIVTADDYMPGFRQAYIWDAIANGYRVLDGGKRHGHR